MAIGVIEFMNPSWYPFMAEHILGITLDQETSLKGNCAGGFPPPQKKKKKTSARLSADLACTYFTFLYLP